ncbi:MAG: putative calcium/sodium:proton antiporter [Methanosaeta sp. PtaU1.Bin028]|nr:MAG: putative calcium/sodium:proton antiporter [Methanosaeta sp. PtaU1.Bin028]
MRGLQLLLLFLPVAILSNWARISDILVFATSALAIIPLAKLLGEATEVLAEKTGPRIGGLLNATFGNAAELIITLSAIRAGQIQLVLASLTGSILGNLLLVLGFAMLLGGLKNGRQMFDRRHVDTDATMTVLALIAMSVPSLFSLHIADSMRIEKLSLTTAAAMLILYILFVVYTLRSCTAEKCDAVTVREALPVHVWSFGTASAIMGLSMAGIALMSELLVASVEAVTDTLGLTPFFVGIIIVPIIGNVAEHLVSVQAARQGKMDLSLSIALGSSLQIALFVTPVLVFASLILGSPLTLQFNQLELIALTAASMISALVSLDGESNWLEGAMLLAVYGILGLAFFFLPLKL